MYVDTDISENINHQWALQMDTGTIWKYPLPLPLTFRVMGPIKFILRISQSSSYCGSSYHWNENEKKKLRKKRKSPAEKCLKNEMNVSAQWKIFFMFLLVGRGLFWVCFFFQIPFFMTMSTIQHILTWLTHHSGVYSPPHLEPAFDLQSMFCLFHAHTKVLCQLIW